MLYFNGTKVPFVKYYINISLVKQAGIRKTAGLFHEEKLKSVYRAFLRGLWKLYEFFITLDFFVL